MRKLISSLAVVFCLSSALASADEGAKTHLFILSGQSNMAGLKPEQSFTPAVTEAFSKDTVIVVKDAQGGQPIRRWYKKWKSADGNGPKADGKLFDRLMDSIKSKVGDAKPDTVTFVWMQGERDAKEGHSKVYAESLKGLIAQLSEALGRDDVNFVIGRLSDHLKTEEWEAVRKAQVEVGESSKRGAWVDTDDLNGPKDGLHYAAKGGYKKLGERFAEKSIELVRKNQ